MTEFTDFGNTEPQPERLDGQDYWDKMVQYQLRTSQLKVLEAELAELRKELERSIHDPVTIPAIVHLPPGSGAYLSRNNYERLPGEPTEFTATGAEILRDNQLVFFNTQEATVWLVVDNPPVDMLIEAVEPDKPSG